MHDYPYIFNLKPRKCSTGIFLLFCHYWSWALTPSAPGSAAPAQHPQTAQSATMGISWWEGLHASNVLRDAQPAPRTPVEPLSAQIACLLLNWVRMVDASTVRPLVGAVVGLLPIVRIVLDPWSWRLSMALEHALLTRTACLRIVRAVVSMVLTPANVLSARTDTLSSMEGASSATSLAQTAILI